MKKIELKNKAFRALYEEICNVQLRYDPFDTENVVTDLCFIIRDLIEEIDRISAEKSGIKKVKNK